jgi:SRSO17 transposase
VPAGQVCLLRDGQATERTYGLIVARNLATGEVKYFVSNAPPDTALEKLLRVAFRRPNVEPGLRMSKSEIGFGHFEGRNYVALMRHLILCLVVLGFVAEQTDRLRGKNPEVTLEQVCRALNQRCGVWLANRRGTSALVHTAAVLVYQQQRNRAARLSRQCHSPLRL